MAYEVFRSVEGDWERVRELRLRALKDTPIAYGERYDDAVVAGEEDWRDRAARSASPGNVQVVARFVDGDDAGRWIGSMAGFVSPGLPAYATGGAGTDPDAPPRANLVGVFVDPQVRGRAAGVTDALLDAVAMWAHDEEGLDRLFLHVHEDNVRAAAYYRRRGFVATGESFPAVLHDGVEQEMVLALR
ncbi:MULTISPECIES: GNAT family N-acetyltransferase [Mumia]|uniref:GNAT family N-acetyltransferase n=1 Tax=Mumia TaxID=1546255 RepID=UPI001423C21B|nr:MULTISPECIES: GNAT family N-acetyltransferase [unclassified Mumia]QMW65603.1 GNAT family N-acetyltransferase [Mumia sp. ZJ1417]